MNKFKEFPEPIMDRKQILQLLCIGVTKLRRMEKAGGFPQPKYLQPTGTFNCKKYWSRKEIEEWRSKQ